MKKINFVLLVLAITYSSASQELNTSVEKMNEPLHTAILANGCFWCTEAVFQRLEGVHTVVSGYTGGKLRNPTYREIGTGRTGHAEAIKIEFNPSVISFMEILDVFFSTHDPTTLNRQGYDVGTQYRSAIFYRSEEQRTLAQAYINALNREKVFDNPVVTEVTAFDVFYEAEDYHQNYYNNNKNQPYCQAIINPKLKKLQQKFREKLKKN